MSDNVEAGERSSWGAGEPVGQGEYVSDFVEVSDLAALVDDKPVPFTAAGHEIVLVKQGDEVYAIADSCSHADVPLSEGEVGPGPHISCWLHGSEFDLRTGEPDEPPAFEPVRVFETKIEEKNGKSMVSVRF